MKVFINPGHCPGIDPGAVGHSGLTEAEVVKNVGALVEKYLQNVGIETESLQDDSLGYICSMANASDADIFISIHCNAAGSPAALGTETFRYVGSVEGGKLGLAIQNQITASLGTVDRGLKDAVPGRNGLYVLSNTDMTAVLVELAFISNPGDEQLLATQQVEFARAIARGVTDYIQMQ